MLDQKLIQDLAEGTYTTLYMVVFSTLFGYVLGLPVGIALNITSKDGIAPNRAVYRVLDIIVNIMRSIPFLLLMTMVMPLSRILLGTSYGNRATILALVIASAPFIARMVESSLNEVDKGVVEAAQSMGADNWTIIRKVLIPEARTSLLVGVTIVFATIIGYTAMAGAIGGKGLGKIAIQDGYMRFKEERLYWPVVIIVILVQIMQALGMMISRKFDRRSR